MTIAEVTEAEVGVAMVVEAVRIVLKIFAPSSFI